MKKNSLNHAFCCPAAHQRPAMSPTPSCLCSHVPLSPASRSLIASHGIMRRACTRFDLTAPISPSSLLPPAFLLGSLSLRAARRSPFVASTDGVCHGACRRLRSVRGQGAVPRSIAHLPSLPHRAHPAVLPLAFLLAGSLSLRAARRNQ